jgi:hypothetical protein
MLGERSGYQAMSLNVKLCLSHSSGIFTSLLARCLIITEITEPRMPLTEAIDTTPEVLPWGLCWPAILVARAVWSSLCPFPHPERHVPAPHLPLPARRPLPGPHKSKTLAVASPLPVRSPQQVAVTLAVPVRHADSSTAVPLSTGGNSGGVVVSWWGHGHSQARPRDRVTAVIRLQERRATVSQWDGRRSGIA